MADNLEDIYCPACGKKMKKIFMPQQGVNLDVCVDGCGGIYFDNREFNKFDEPHEDISPLIEIFAGRVYEKADENVERICPACRNKMVKNFASSKHQIQVDECYHCGGKFLDFGELDKIREQYNTESERAGDAIKELYAIAGKEIEDIKIKHNSVKDNYAEDNKGFVYYAPQNRNRVNIAIIVLIILVLLAILCVTTQFDVSKILFYKI